LRVATTLNESAVEQEPAGAGARRQRLLHPGRVPNTKVLLDRIALAAGASFELHTRGSDIGWVQVLEGAAVLDDGAEQRPLGPTALVFMPPGFEARVSSRAGAVLLSAHVPDAVRFDPALAETAPPLRIVDWTHEPVLASEHDARKRIYVATPKLFGTKAIKGEMIIYPPDTQAPDHHHVGAEHFMYVLQGRGTAYADDEPIPVRKGDLIYYGECERHHLKSEGGEDMVFVEFFVPGQYRTVWSPGAAVCAWNPTGRTISGAAPAREIKGHSSALPTPQDV
jgi:mannose-6-phosphate isomerase-like protein (cupin superfamily)